MKTIKFANFLKMMDVPEMKGEKKRYFELFLVSSKRGRKKGKQLEQERNIWGESVRKRKKRRKRERSE